MASIGIDVIATLRQLIAIALGGIGMIFIFVALGVISYHKGRISVRPNRVTGLIGIVLMLIGLGVGVFPWKPLFRPLALPETTTLSPKIKAFNFDKGPNDEWFPLDDPPYVIKSGELVLATQIPDGPSGTFLKYTLNLESRKYPGYTMPIRRNAVFYAPVKHKNFDGIIANIYWDDREDPGKPVMAEFFVTINVDGHEQRFISHPCRLAPRQWNTVVWDLYGPIYWSEEYQKKTAQWRALKDNFGEELFGGPIYWLSVGKRHNYEEVQKIGVSFLVSADHVSEGETVKAEGTVYLDNIQLIYAQSR